VLVDRKELASVALERTRMPIVITDARQTDNPIVLANQAFLDLSGYSDAEIIGRNCRFLQGPETSPETIDRVRSAVANGESLTVELLNYRKDGSKFWNKLLISPIRDKDGRVIYFFASQVDVTDTYRARELQDTEHRLLREVDHRAMNALALVQAIVRLSRTDSVERYAEVVQGRVGALARAHVVLAQGGWKGADLDGLVRAELQAVSNGDVAVEGNSVHVSSDQVQPLLLVLHEMADDAVRNGALAAPGGALRVRCWRDGVGGRQGFEWRETGGPPGAAGRTPEFASFLVTTLVERQLKGAISWRQGPGGLEADVRLPVLA
jgi:PAS domain S-box-containing protein